MTTLDLTSPNTVRRMRLYWHQAGCSTEHDLANCPGAADVNEDIDDLLAGLRQYGDAIDVEAMTFEQLLEAWHHGCNRIGRPHRADECDDELIDLLAGDVNDVVRPMLETVSF